MFVRSRLAAAFAAAALGAATSLAATAASINDLRALGFRPIAADTLTIDVHEGGVVLLRADSATRGEALRLARELVHQGHNGGSWDGQGFVGSDVLRIPYTRLAVALNGHDGVPLFSSFAGAAADENTIFVAHTWYGDIDLDGRVTPDDYFRIDADFLEGTRARGGDLNGDGRVNADDYFLADASFLVQSLPRLARFATVLSLEGPAHPTVPAVPLPSAGWGGLFLLAGIVAHRLRRRALPR